MCEDEEIILEKTECYNKTIRRGVSHAKVSFQTSAGDKHRLNSNYVERKSIPNIHILSQLWYTPIPLVNQYILRIISFRRFVIKVCKKQIC